MVGQQSKPSLRSQKREVTGGKANLQQISPCSSSLNKTKAEAKASKKNSADSVSPAAKNYKEQVKMKQMDLTPRNRGMETSEGVQEFIRHVSDIIGQKNPFKENIICSWPKGSKTNSSSPSVHSVQFNGVSKKVEENKPQEDTESVKNYEIDMNKINKKLIRRLKYMGKLNSISALKKDSSIAKGKVNRPKSSKKRREQKDKNSEKETFPGAFIEAKTVKVAGKEREEVSAPKKPSLRREDIASAPLQNENIRKRRPSEIPLRKNRTDSTRKPKPLSPLLGKPLSEIEGPTFVDLDAERCFWPVETVHDCTELQMTINVDLSSEKISIIGEEIQPPASCQSENTNSNINLDIESSDIFDCAEYTSQEVLEDKPSKEQKTKVINLEKVKTSSFTVLKNNSVVRSRLESLHKKNVLSKEKSTIGKGSSHVPLTSNSSFGSLKRNSSKKSITSCLSSKGNKRGLKIKFKKTKTEPREENLCNRSKSKTETLYRKENTMSGRVQSQRVEKIATKSLKTDTVKKDDSQLRSTRSVRETSTSSKATAPRRKEEELVETPSTKTVVSDNQNESQSVSKKFERPLSVRNPLLSKVKSERSMIPNNSTEKQIERMQHFENVPITPPPNPPSTPYSVYETRHTEEDDGWSTKTVTFDDRYNIEVCSCPIVESEITQTIPERNSSSSGSPEISKVYYLPLIVKGTPLNIGKDEPPEKLEELKSPTVKKRLNINLRTQEFTSEEEEENENKFVEVPVKSSSNGAEKCSHGEEGSSKSENEYLEFLPTETTNNKPLCAMTRKSYFSLKKKLQPQSDGCMKGARKKKVRSDAGYRPSPSASVLFNSDLSIQSKSKHDTKVRSGLTKSSKREEKSDVLEDMVAVKLKRRNSEPNSFRGYVWKCAEAATPKDHKTSVSSLTSSLRHLNTDDIDDFTFWEPVPQKMSSCWEMSLYHYRRPWSVLSCSVFRDNRKSSTPGLILENLRSGGVLSSRRFAVNQNERVACRNENPFDVEPSIAQKNIDIRNWLAALNFPTLPSTSNDVFPEGSFTTQTIVNGQNSNKPQVSQKRRKVLPNFKFPEEESKKNLEEEKYRKSTKWCNEEGLTDLVRRKSGGFVTCEQFLNSEQSAHRPNVTVNFCVYSKSTEDSILVETSDRNSFCEPRKYKSVEIATQPELSISATIINSGAVVGDQLVEKIKTKEKPSLQIPVQDDQKHLGKILKQEFALFHSDINIWKYLFLLTIFIITVHYCYVNSYMCYN